MIKYDTDPQVEEQYSQDEENRGTAYAEPAAEPAYEHVGWPGDGSGLDDLADMHANEGGDF
tara:strand:+ start:1808 stop:1990 length:183 start_codon:yes stop_codon:yes gene_type:complete